MAGNPWIDTVSGLGSLISGVAAFVAAWISYITLREMARQRQEELLPYLATESAFLYLYLHWTKSDSDLPCPVWSTEEKLGANARQGSVGIRIRNIGRGPARRIRATWQYDAESAVRDIRRLDREAEFCVRQGTNDWLDFAKGFNQILPMERGTATPLGDLLPRAAIPDTTLVYLPTAFLLLCAAVWYLKWTSPAPPPTGDPNAILPHLNLSLSYEDLAGTVQETTVRLSLSFVSAHQRKPGEGFHGTTVTFAVIVTDECGNGASPPPKALDLPRPATSVLEYLKYLDNSSGGTLRPDSVLSIPAR